MGDGLVLDSRAIGNNHVMYGRMPRYGRGGVFLGYYYPTPQICDQYPGYYDPAVGCYGLEPLGYRVGARHTGLSDGFAVFRCRPWGKAIECVLCDVVVPEDDQRLTDELIDKVQKAAPADYIIRLDQRRVTRGPFVRLPRVGPILTCRPLDAFPAPELGRWRPTVGDVELF